MSLLEQFIERRKLDNDGVVLAGIVTADLCAHLRSVGQDALADALEGDGLAYAGPVRMDTGDEDEVPWVSGAHNHGASLFLGGCHEDHSQLVDVFFVKESS